LPSFAFLSFLQSTLIMDNHTLPTKDEQPHTVLTSVRKRQVGFSEKLPFYGDCRDVEDFQKLNRVGEGTYGVV
jgi:cyclin-dependent kinase 10